MRKTTFILAAAFAASLVPAAVAHAQPSDWRIPTPCAGKPNPDTTAYPAEALDSLPRMRKGRVPHFSVLPAMGTELRVRVAFVVNQDGTVDPRSVHLVGDSTRSAFDQDAKHWIATLLFWPACREGMPVRAQVVQPVNYNQAPVGRGPVR